MLATASPGPIVGALALGPLAALVAAMAAMVLVLTIYTLLSGHGQEGLEGFKRDRLGAEGPRPADLGERDAGALPGRHRQWAWWR